MHLTNAPATLPDRSLTGRITTHIRSYADPTLWINIAGDAASGVHNFTPELIEDFNTILAQTRQRVLGPPRQGVAVPAYAVIASTDPDYFSQGGDLAFFLACIRNQDAATLHAYSMRCLELLMAWSSDLKAHVTTVSLVQGRALGGGFELLLSADHIIAEEQSTFGFPEILFGLFPTTGAMGLVSARTNPYVAAKMMTNKKIYTAHELLAMGLVDDVCQQGAGEQAVERYIASHSKRRKAHLKVQQSRHRMSIIDAVEAARVVDDWVETAMQLDQNEIRQLEMLVLLQQGERQNALARKVA